MAQAVEIIGMGGLMGLVGPKYSLGIPQIVNKLAKDIPGVNARVYHHDEDQAALDRAIAAAKRGAAIVGTGHSLGANSWLQIAEALANLGIPVSLLFLFDPTWNYSRPAVGANVARCISIYNTSWLSLLGKGQVRAGPGFKGHLANIPSAQLHQNVDDDLSAHKLFEREVRFLVGLAPKPVEVINAIAARIERAQVVQAEFGYRQGPESFGGG
jgi:hypothetical protein